MSKKLIKNMALLVALLALCLTAAFSASAATENGYTYTVTDGKATITAVDSTVTGDVVIPDTLGGYPVTEIGGTYNNWGGWRGAFQDRTDLTNVTIGNSVTSIDKSAFCGCTGLTSIIIPDSVTNIGESAFYNCAGLTSITIPENVTSIGYFAFSGCTGLAQINWNAKDVSYNGRMEAFNPVFIDAGTDTNGIDVIFGDTVESVPDFAFCATDDCENALDINENIKSVTLVSSVRSIGKYAFYSCAGLTNVTIPDSVTSIGSSAFAGTAWLDAQPYGDVYAGKVYYTYKGTMPENTSIVIKNGTKSIADSAFYQKRT